FPVLEGQSIGVIPPGEDRQGKAHHARQYSVASQVLQRMQMTGSIRCCLIRTLATMAFATNQLNRM
ncbi:MAG: hypothetical protein EBV92_07150, partial [Betaproteobacteria bacterium]|nr:hypothetical protein [Betaproteobacteria bacterium]